MKHYVWADTMAEAEAIVEHLENCYDNYTGRIARHNLLVTWLDTEFDGNDWRCIYDTTLDKLEENSPEYQELLEQGCL